MKILILAGGTGKRLWPVSRQKSPKQSKSIIGNKTLLKATCQRVAKGFKKADIFLSVNLDQLAEINKDLCGVLQKHLIIEPVKRGTAAAIGLACINFKPDDIIATVNSDHHIKNEQKFLQVLRQAEKVIKKYPDHLLLIGINPTYPDTGLGYIKLADEVDKIGKDKIFKVESFKEKPDLATAKKYLKSWTYLWNPAYFVFRVNTMLKLFKKHLPAQYKILMKIKNNPKLLPSEFKKINKISVDYGIIEKAKKMLCLPADFDWADIGHWQMVQEVLASKPTDNVIKGKYIHLDGQGNLIYSYSDKLIATVGVKNSIIIETEDAILVCPKERAQEVKKIVEELERKKMKKYL